ncbi:MAG: hypothetical protein U5K29_02100 [Acidimicrobiales bacterium]|nr:hypothetical protein [Acidimicrobiales bacterium]
MGAIRKTMSVVTLGVVPFRSKKERLQQAETASRLAELELEKEQQARIDADQRVAAADQRARDAEGRLLKEAKAAASRRRRRRSEPAGGVRVGIGRFRRRAGTVAARSRDEVEATTKAARKEFARASKAARKDAKRLAAAAKKDKPSTTVRTRRAARKAAKAAKAEAKATKKKAKATGKKLRKGIEATADRAQELAGD